MVLNTAQAVTAVLSTGGGTRYADFGITAGILSAFVIAQGLAQLVAIESKPLPNYFKGRSGGPAELAVVAEHGPELIGQESTGFRLVAQQGITRLNAGDQVFTTPKTHEVMRDHELVAGRLVARNPMRDHHLITGHFAQQRQQADVEQQTQALRAVSPGYANSVAAEARAAVQSRQDTERLLDAAARIEQAVRAIPKTRFVDGREMEYIEERISQIRIQDARYRQNAPPRF